jgi:hypothetical protein
MHRLLLAPALLAAFPAAAQELGMHHGMEMPAPAPAPAPSPSPAPQHHPGHHDAMEMPAEAPGAGHAMAMAPAGNATPGSGTSRLPAAEGGMHGLHLATGDWMVMAHGKLLAAWTDQGGPRGGDMAYTGSMAMLSAERTFGGGARLQLRTMFSLDPLNGQRGYPNLFATGETAHGQPLVDRQHPHDLFMELSARVDVPLGSGLTGFLYGGPVAEPALGPSAFVHRRSARYLPLSPIGHHWFDSTHVTFGVVTAGLATSAFQLEASAFRGREPDEHRWDIETPRLDSWSVRATWSPTPSWTVQASHGRLDQPEASHPGEDERRTTASVHYARGGLSAMLGFAAKDRVPGDTLTAWLAEANWDLSKHHSLFGRIENVASDELFPDHAHPLHDRTFRVTRFETGYAYRIALSENAELALGGSLAAYAKPAALDPFYGQHPLSYTLFARLAIGD